MNFKKIYGRLNAREFPLSIGTNSIKIIESKDEDAKPFSEVIRGIIESQDPRDIQLLTLERILYVELFTETTPADRTDMEDGLANFDKASEEYRKSLLNVDLNKPEERAKWYMEEERRVYTTVTTHVPQDIKTFQFFYSINYDFSEDVLKEKGMGIIKTFQHKALYTVVLPGRYLKENEKDPIVNFFNDKAKYLKNIYVDSPEYIDDLYVCIKTLE